MLPGHLVQMEIGGLVQDHICEMIQAFSFVVAVVLAGELEILAVLSSLKMTRELSTFNFMAYGDWVTVLSWLANREFLVQLHVCPSQGHRLVSSGGHILYLHPDEGFSKESRTELLFGIAVIALNSSHAAEGELYIDDGKSFEFKQGAYIHRHFVFSDGKLTSSSLVPNASKTLFSSACVIERIIVLGHSSGPKNALIEPSNRKAEIELGPLWLRRGRLVTVDDENGPVTSVSWVADGILQLIDWYVIFLLRTLRGGHQSRVGSLDWKNHILTTRGMDGKIINNDVRVHSHIVATFRGHRQEVCGLKWSTSGQQLASGGNDNLLYIWDRSMASMHSRSQWLHRLEDHTAAVKALACDCCMKFWNTHNGACLNSVDAGSQSPDGHTVATAAGDETQVLECFWHPRSEKSCTKSRASWAISSYKANPLGFCLDIRKYKGKKKICF
ncbi:hypothetical protein AAG906_007591 [Vitis piasezkii]